MEELIEGFKLPEIKDKFNIKKGEWDEFQKDIKDAKFKLQEINDNLDGRILSNNIHNDAITTRHLQAQIVTTEKLEAGAILLATVAKDFIWSILGDDGHKPADDADVTTNSNFVTAVYPADQSDIQNQIDGKIVSYFQETDPNTWSVEDRPKHNGDMWYKASTHLLKRYKASTNEWELIEDQKAIDAYADAATAQDTADGKRRVFTATPTTPYDVGDLWTAGPTGDLKKCKTARASGAYVAGDWELASKYDKTSENTAADIINLPATPSIAGLYADGSHLGYHDGSVWKAYIQNDGKFYFTGDATHYIQWNGSTLTIKGLVSADALSVLNANLGTITAGNITLNTSGYIRSSGKTYGAALAGFYLGYHSTAYKMDVGNASNWIRWDGTSLQIKGRLSVGSATNEDIYFEDSAIRMYDFLSGNNKGLAWRYSTFDFAFLTHNPTTEVSLLTLGGNSTEWIRLLVDDPNDNFYLEAHHDIGTAYNVRLYLNPVGAASDFKFHGTGQIQLPNMGSNPTANNAVGCICSVSGVLKFYDGAAWKTVSVT